VRALFAEDARHYRALLARRPDPTSGWGLLFASGRNPRSNDPSWHLLAARHPPGAEVAMVGGLVVSLAYYLLNHRAFGSDGSYLIGGITPVACGIFGVAFGLIEFAANASLD